MSPRSTRLIAGGFLLLLLNSIYLAASAEPTLFYFTNVALHPVLGLTLVAAIVLRRQLPAPGRVSPFLTLTVVILLLGLLTGVGVLVLGATRPYRPLLLSHVATTVFGVETPWSHMSPVAFIVTGVPPAAFGELVSSIDLMVKRAQRFSSRRLASTAISRMLAELPEKSPTVGSNWQRAIFMRQNQEYGDRRAVGK